MSERVQSDQQAANSAVPDTETLPRWDDPDWEAYLAFLGARDDDEDNWDEDDEEAFEICEDCGELLDDCACDLDDEDDSDPSGLPGTYRGW